MKDIRELLIHSLDNPLSETDRKRLEKALAQSVELRKEKEELLKMRSLLAGFKVESDPDWHDELISKLPVRKTEAKIIQYPFTMASIFPKLAAACAIILLMSIINIYQEVGTINRDAVIGIDEVTADEAYAYLETNYFENE